MGDTTPLMHDSILEVLLRGYGIASCDIITMTAETHLK